MQKEKKEDYVLLGQAAREIEEDGKDAMRETPLLSCSTLERVLVDRLSLDHDSVERQMKGKEKIDGQDNYIEYLVSCFRIGNLRLLFAYRNIYWPMILYSENST